MMDRLACRATTSSLPCAAIPAALGIGQVGASIVGKRHNSRWLR